jgi:DNA-binding MarR family transcriptional regulator
MANSSAALREENRDAPAGALPRRLSDLLGFQLRMAQAAVFRDFAAAMSGSNLTQRQLAVLEIVHGAPGISQVDIAALLLADRATMMAIVDRLQDRRLVGRRRSDADRRRQELYVTPLGAQTLEQARGIIAEHEKRFTDRFSEEELKAFLDGLARIQA